ncbi:unnamed protein product [Absidia cylindrospora]
MYASYNTDFKSVTVHNGIKIELKNLDAIDVENLDEHSHPPLSKANLIAAGKSPSLDKATKDQICSDIDVNAKLVSNTIQRGESGPKKINEQVQQLEDDGFIMSVKKNKRNEVQMLLITNEDSVVLTQHYGDVLSVDATYDTNDKKLPVFNIVGFTNLGTDRLSTFIAASIVMNNEMTGSCLWDLSEFKNIVWPNKSAQT